MQALKDIAIWFPVIGLVYLAEMGFRKLMDGGSLWWLTPMVVFGVMLVAFMVDWIARDKSGTKDKFRREVSNE